MEIFRQVALVANLTLLIRVAAALRGLLLLSSSLRRRCLVVLGDHLGTGFQQVFVEIELYLVRCGVHDLRELANHLFSHKRPLALNRFRSDLFLALANVLGQLFVVVFALALFCLHELFLG